MKHILLVSILVLIIIIIGIYRHYKSIKKEILIPNIIDGTDEYHITEDKITMPGINGGVEMALSFWIYIKTWNYKYGSDKIILFWEGVAPNDNNQTKKKCKEILDKDYYQDNESTSITPKRSLWRRLPDICEDSSCKPKLIYGSDSIESFQSNIQPNYSDFKGLKIFLRKEDNALVIKKGLINGSYENVVVDDIKIQKWLNITINMDLRNLDVFINGKLRSSRFFETIPNLFQGSLVLNPYKGFDGKISNLHYFNYKLKIKEIKKLHNKGYKYNSILLSIPDKIINDVSDIENDFKDSDFNINKKYIEPTWKLNVNTKKKLYVNQLCKNDSECKGGLNCIDSYCSYQQQSRKRDDMCWTNSDCLYGLSCNNWGNDELTNTQLKGLQKQGLKMNDHDKWNSKLSKKPFVCY